MTKNKILALKYRPQEFKDLIGQEVMAETVTTAIKLGKTPNAYLLTGIRGVGKTTTAVNLATALVSERKRVLLIDLDPQGNASTGVGFEQSKDRNDIYDVLHDSSKIFDAVHKTSIPKLKLIPSTLDLSGAEVELARQEEREVRLKNAIEKVKERFDYILIDCPPALGILTVNAFTAANSIIVPMQCEFYSLEGLSHLVHTINRVKKTYNPHLSIEGLVLTMVDKRNSLTDQVKSDIKGFFGKKVYKTVIPRNVRVSEAPSFGKPVLIYDSKCKGSKAYLGIAKEYLKQEKKKGVKQ